jgi:hypothetical protein
MQDDADLNDPEIKTINIAFCVIQHFASLCFIFSHVFGITVFLFRSTKSNSLLLYFL